MFNFVNKKESQTAQRTSRLSHRQHTDENEPKQKIICSEIKILLIIILKCQDFFLANRAKFDLELIGHREFNKGFESFMNLVFFSELR